MAKFVYDHETCSRCGGTGKWSYNYAYGNTCFKCNGSGVSISKKGERAKAKVKKLVEALWNAKAKDLKEGDSFRTQDGEKWRVAVEIKEAQGFKPELADQYMDVFNTKLNGTNFVETTLMKDQFIQIGKPLTKEIKEAVKRMDGVTIEE